MIYNIPILKRDKVSVVLQYFENNNIKYGIEGNTLEDAFIELGDNKKHEDGEKREQLYQTIFANEYKTNFIRLVIALSYRRFALMFTNPILILKFIAASLLPPILIYASQGGKPITI